MPCDLLHNGSPRLAPKLNTIYCMSKIQLFAKLKKEYDHYYLSRQKIIGVANDALANSKQAIFSLHRDNIKEAEKLLLVAEKKLSGLRKYFNQNLFLEDEGAYRAAIEEYAEAKLFWQVLTKGKIDFIKDVNLYFAGYLGGLCDLTGELLRKIILLATAEKFKEAQKLKDILSDIVAQMIKFNLTGYLRNKFDAAKHNLRKAEEVLYDIKIKSLR